MRISLGVYLYKNQFAVYYRYDGTEEGIRIRAINTLKFKVVSEPVKKTDKHDVRTIVEFLKERHVTGI